MRKRKIQPGEPFGMSLTMVEGSSKTRLNSTVYVVAKALRGRHIVFYQLRGGGKKSENRDTRGTSTNNKEENGDPKMYEEEMDDEWERNIREDEEAMERELVQQQERMDTWLEKEEHELARDRFGDG